MRALKERARFLAILFIFLLVLPLVNISRYACLDNEELLRHPRNHYGAAESDLLGSIVDRQGRPLAFMKEGERRYPLGPAAGPLLGYCNPVYGLAGLEAQLSERLQGFSVPRSLNQALLLWDKRDRRGDDLQLTIDSQLQRRAYEALAGRRGAAVLLEVPTGEILAMASRPAYDPNFSALKRDWARLTRDPQAPLVERAGQGMYPPGSVFKPLIMAAALEEGLTNPQAHFDCQGRAQVGNFVLNCHDRHGMLSLAQALAYSCNVAFADLGMRLGMERIRQWMRTFQMEGRLSAVPGAVTAKLPEASNPSAPAETAIGQADTLVSPLNMARLAAIIARGGLDIEPRLLKAQVREGEEIIWQPPWPQPRRVLSAQSAQLVAQAMLLTVEEGTGTAAQVAGVQVAGKTGSAENPHGATHAWFIGYAPAQKPRYAVAVILENAGGGGRYAAPCAQKILKAALASQP